MPSLQELREQSLNAVNQAQAIINLADADTTRAQPGLTAEEHDNVKRYLADGDRLAQEVRTRMDLERQLSDLRSSAGVSPAARPDTTAPTYRDAFPDFETIQRSLPTDPVELKALEARAIDAYIRSAGSMVELEPEERYLVRSRTRNLRQLMAPGEYRELAARREFRAMAVGVDVTGGLLVPTMMQTQIVEAQKAFGGMVGNIHTETTQSGAPLPVPTDNDTSNKGHRVGENQARTETDVTVGAVVLYAYLYTSDFINVSLEFLQDASIDVTAWLSKKIGIRIARGLNTDLTVGSGPNSPQGIVSLATSGITTASNSTISFDEYIKAKHSVDPAYRLGAKWMFNDSTLLAAKLQKDSTGRYLWTSGIAMNAPDMIDGDQYIVNQDMPSIGSGTTPVLYGALENYWHRAVGGTNLVVLRERYADLGQVAFLGFERHDGNLIDAGTHPVKCITMHA